MTTTTRDTERGTRGATMDNPTMEITVKFRVSCFGTESDAIAWCREIGVDPSLLGYVRWLAEEEGLMGIVEDGYEITAAELVRSPEHST